VVVTYGDLGRSPGWGGFRVDFGSVKEIVSRGSSLGQARLRELVAGSWRPPRGCRSRRGTGSPTSRGGVGVAALVSGVGSRETARLAVRGEWRSWREGSPAG
jgi:hypothetical protein